MRTISIPTNLDSFIGLRNLLLVVLNQKIWYVEEESASVDLCIIETIHWNPFNGTITLEFEDELLIDLPQVDIPIESSIEDRGFYFDKYKALDVAQQNLNNMQYKLKDEREKG